MNKDSSRVVWNFSGARSAVRFLLLLLCLLSLAEVIGCLSWASRWYGLSWGAPLLMCCLTAPLLFLLFRLSAVCAPVLRSLVLFRPTFKWGVGGAFSFGTAFEDDWSRGCCLSGS